MKRLLPILLLVFSAPTFSLEMLSQKKSKYDSLKICIERGKQTAEMFRIMGPPNGITEVEVIHHDHSPHGAQYQVFYKEKSHKFVTYFVCEPDGTAIVTHHRF